MNFDKEQIVYHGVLILMIVLYKLLKHNKKLTLYYQVRNGGLSLREGFQYEINDFGEGDNDFAGNTIYVLRNKNYEIIADSFISFSNNRVKPDNSVISGLQKETLKESFIVKDQDGDIFNASSLYVDEGSSSTTTIPEAVYSVNSGTGKYKNATKAIVQFNEDGTRKIDICF